MDAVVEGAEGLRRDDSSLVKALARALRWKQMLESGEFFTIAELTEREGITSSYITRVLRLTLLAPDIVEAILDGRQGPEVTLARMLEPFPPEWKKQNFNGKMGAPYAPRANTTESCKSHLRKQTIKN